MEPNFLFPKKENNIIADHINLKLKGALEIVQRDLKWWEKLLPWKKLFRRGFYAGVTYSSLLQDKGFTGKKIIKELGKSLHDSAKIKAL